MNNVRVASFHIDQGLPDCRASLLSWDKVDAEVGLERPVDHNCAPVKIKPSPVDGWQLDAWQWHDAVKRRRSATGGGQPPAPQQQQQSPPATDPAEPGQQQLLHPAPPPRTGQSSRTAGRSMEAFARRDGSCGHLRSAASTVAFALDSAATQTHLNVARTARTTTRRSSSPHNMELGREKPSCGSQPLNCRDNVDGEMCDAGGRTTSTATCQRRACSGLHTRPRLVAPVSSNSSGGAHCKWPVAVKQESSRPSRRRHRHSHKPGIVTSHRTG